jgi:dTDP-glucose 4,6-dehydratase
LLHNSLKANLKLFIQISTDEVYGSLDKTGYFTEETNINPNSPYSASKAAADMFCRSYFETFKFPISYRIRKW